MKKISILIITILIITGCLPSLSPEKIYEMYHEQVESVGELTDEMVENYVNAYRALKGNGINYLDFMEENKDSLDTENEAFNQVDSTLKSYNFADYAEFVKVNAKIAWAWNISQGQIGLMRFEKLHDNSQAMIVEQGIEPIQELLNDPDIPEDVKADLRVQLEELKQMSAELQSTYDENLGWAEIAMGYVTPLTNEHDMDIIMRHEMELMEVFSGLTQAQLEAVQQNSLYQLDYTK